MYQQTYYVLYEDGSTGVLSVESQVAASVGEGPVLTKPGRVVTVDEYDAARGMLKAAHQTYVDSLVAADLGRNQSDYEALRRIGVPDDTARRVTGFTHEAEARV